MMRPEDVDPALVEKAMWAVAGEQPACAECGENGPAACVYCKDDAEKYARHALAAVLPDARYAAKVEAITEARKVISQYLATAEKWRHARVMWAFAIMLGEIPQDTPCPESPADAEDRRRADRLTDATEEPT